MRIVGVDGCKAGWVAAASDGAFDDVEITVFPTFDAVLDAHPAPAIIAVDMPIGLPRRSGPGGRVAEAAARAALGRARASSVYAIPARCAVYAAVRTRPPDRMARFRAAVALARKASDTGAGFSIQTFGILPKVVEVDRCLRRRAGAADRVFEVHPELAFTIMSGTPCTHPKKTSAGESERLDRLAAAGIARAQVLPRLARRGAGVARDDVVDALACLVVARRIASGDAVSFPSPPAHDEQGLPIAIWA